jgi:hypothetical protein
MIDDIPDEDLPIVFKEIHMILNNNGFVIDIIVNSLS